MKSHDALLTPFMRAERHPDGLHQSQADLSLRNELQILSLDVPDTMEPVTIGDLRLPANTRAIARIRESAETLVDVDTELRAGDVLLNLVAHDDQETVQKLFGSTGNI